MDPLVVLYEQLFTTIDPTDATNIILVLEGARPGALVEIDEDSYEQVVDLISPPVGIFNLRRVVDQDKTTIVVIVYNTKIFTATDVAALVETDAGLGQLLGYMCNANEMEEGQYVIDYLFDKIQLYAQVCQYVDDRRRHLAQEQLERYQQIGDRLGIKFRLFIGRRSTPETSWAFEINDPLKLWQRRDEITQELEENFPLTSQYFDSDNYFQWLKNYQRYHKLWGSIGVINSVMLDINPRLEVNLYQSWDSGVKD